MWKEEHSAFADLAERVDPMERKHGYRILALLLALVMVLPLLSGCAGKRAAKEDADTITVYMWSSALYDRYAPYIQYQLPDVNIQFVVGNNDLDFYKFMNEHGALPDVITCRRFALHDATPLKDSLMDLSTTAEAGAVYDSYLHSFTNEDGSINWLPLCGELDGLVANRGLFEKYKIPLPTDYDSFVSACQTFEEVGIRGFVSDFAYDYTCMEVLQALSIPEITSLEGRTWRSGYEDPDDDTVTGLDTVIWPGAFERMEQFINDVNIRPEDVELDYDPVINLFTEGKAAVIRSGGWNVMEFQRNNVDAIALPYFGSNGEQWLLTYPQFQVALNRDLSQNAARQEKAMRVLNVMLSEEAQNILSKGGDVIAYSQNVNLELSPHLENLTPLIEQNHLYIRIASNDFFAVSKDVVSKMIAREYNAQQAYEAFDAQLRQPKDAAAQTVLTCEKAYSNRFHSNGGNEAYSVMANSLRSCYGSDVLIAPANSFTGSVLKADYTEKMVGSMIMPNSLEAYQRKMSGAELKETVKAYVEGIEGGFKPFNRGSLPTVSGISMEVKEDNGSYTLTRIQKDGKEVADGDTFRVTCLNTAAYMAPFLSEESRVFEKAQQRVKFEWISYILGGGTLAQPESYMKLR